MMREQREIGELDAILLERCILVAGQIVKRSYVTMALEAQATSVEFIAQQIAEMANRFFHKVPKFLWDFDPAIDTPIVKNEKKNYDRRKE